MANNFFVAYDLMSPGQNYDAVRDRIKSLGSWHQFQFSLFYVNTTFTAQEAHAHVRAAMDENDRLAIINATAAIISVYAQPLIDAVNFVWFAPSP
jgi:hypothetical protein